MTRPSPPDESTLGWHSRGYLPHFDGGELAQFITFRLHDSLPREVLIRWKQELTFENNTESQSLLRRRVEAYLDQGHGSCYLRIPAVGQHVQNAILFNKLLNQSGRFWQKEYFDRYIPNARQFAKTVAYIENNPVKANLCDRPEDWPFSSARFRKK